MANYDVYITAGASSGGVGTEGSPYNTVDDFESNFTTDFAPSTTNLVTENYSIILNIEGTLTITTRHDWNGFTTGSVIGTEPGDNQTIWVQGKDDGDRVDPATGVGHTLTNTSTGFETNLCRYNIGFQWLVITGADMTSASAGEITQHAGYRQFGSGNTSSVLRYVMGLPGRQLITTESSNAGTLLMQDCILDYVAGGAREESYRLEGSITTLELNHCITVGRLVSVNSAPTNITLESCMNLNEGSIDYYATGKTLVAWNRSAFYSDTVAAESNSNYYTTTATGNLFAQTARTSGWFEDESAGDYTLTSTGNTAVGTSGGGTSTTNVLATSFNGQSRASGSSAIGPFEFVTAGGTGVVHTLANNGGLAGLGGLAGIGGGMAG